MILKWGNVCKEVWMDGRIERREAEKRRGNCGEKQD